MCREGKSVLREKSFDFGLIIIEDCRHLKESKKETHRSDALLLKELIKMLIASINTVKKNAG